MAQTTGQISSRDFKIETSVDGAAWEDQSGITFTIDPGDQVRATGSRHTFDGDTPLTTSGKLEARTLKIEFAYTEGASDLYADVLAAQINNTAFYIRWHPKGGQSNEFKFTTAAGTASKLTDPKGDADSGAPVVCAFELFTAGVTKGVN